MRHSPAGVREPRFSDTSLAVSRSYSAINRSLATLSSPATPWLCLPMGVESPYLKGFDAALRCARRLR